MQNSPACVRLKTVKPRNENIILDSLSMARYISFAVLLAILTLIGILFYKVMIGFFVPVFIAVVLVVVFQPLHRWVLDVVTEKRVRQGWEKR